MARGNFERQLYELQEKLLILGSKVTSNLRLAAVILYRADAQEAHRLIAADEAINQAQVQIEQMCLSLIATQQPRATDLRLITAVSAIASELERINDYAKGIAKISLSFNPVGLGSEVAILREMGDQLQGMLTGAIDAFIERDVPQACAIHAADQAIDTLYQQIQQELLAYLTTHVEVMQNATKLMWAAHNYERAGDRIGNICERVVFLVTGEIIELPYNDEAHLHIKPEVSYVSSPD